MNTFTLFWLNGKSELVQGQNIDDALKNSVHHKDMTNILDFYVAGMVQHEYEWNNVVKTWEHKLEYQDERN